MNVNKDLNEAPLCFDKPTKKTETLNEESIESKKKKILDNYILKDLSLLQEIKFTFQKSKETITLNPKMEVEIYETKYYVFYNNDLIKLKQIFFSKLEDLIEEHYLILNYDKSALYEKANSSVYESKLKLPIQVWRMIGNLVGPQSYLFAPINIIRKVVSLTNYQILKLAKIYATTCANLNFAINKYGIEINDGKICYILINKDFNEFIYINESEELPIIEKTYLSIFKSGISDDKIIQAFDTTTKNLIYTYESSNDVNNICFILFRASYYLGIFESELQYKDLKTLENMDKFKKQLIRDYLNFRFPIFKNISPIQNIELNNCRLIQQTDKATTIYINRIETQRFIKLINESLDSKIRNLSRKYKLDAFKDNEFRELAESIDFNYQDNIVKYVENQIINLEAEMNLNNNTGRRLLLKSGLLLLKQGTDIIIEYKKNKIMNFSQNEIENSLKQEKENKQKKSFSFNKFLKGNFENPKNIVVDSLVQNKNTESKVETVSFPHNEIKAINNLSLVRKSLEDLQLGNHIDEIFNGLNYYINGNRLQKQIDILTKQKNQLEGIKDYMGNFINLVKLYCELKKRNLDINDNYEGIFLSENKYFTVGNNEIVKGNEMLLEYRILVF